MTGWITEFAWSITLLIVIVSHARAYFDRAPAARWEGLRDRKFWKGPPSTLGSVACTLGDGRVSGWINVEPFGMWRGGPVGWGQLPDYLL